MSETKSTRVNRRLVPIVLIGAIVYVTLNAWIALRSIEWLEKTERWVDHTWEVIAQVERMVESAQNAESSSRAYVLTGEPRFLQPYLAARTDLPNELDVFVKLTTDNVSQQRRAEEMRAAIAHRLDLLEQTDALRKPGLAVDTPYAMLLMDRGTTAMDELRLIANEMGGEERRLLAERTRESETAARHVRWTLSSASALDLMLIVFMFRYFIRERELRVVAELSASLPDAGRLAGLRDRFEAELARLRPDVVLFGRGGPRLPNTSAFAVPGITAERLMIALDLGGIAVSSGSACSSGKVGRSHVLEAMGVGPDLRSGAIRVSLGWRSTESDVEDALTVLAEALGRMTKRMLLAAA